MPADMLMGTMPSPFDQPYYQPSGMMGAAPVPGASMYPPAFSYGLPQHWGSQAGPASWGASAVGNVPSAMSTVGMMAGLGTMFSSSPLLRGLSFLDPTTAGMEMGAARFMAARAGGATMGSALGAGAMAGAGPVALGMAMYQAAAYTGQQFMTGAREQQMLGAQLSGIGFANPMAAGGRGFGFGQLQQIGQMMRQVDSADPFTTMKDLNGLMDQFTGMGMHRGIQDAREFGRKFKEFATGVREMAKELGTTLEEAGQLRGAFRQTGFYSSGDVMGNTRSMQLSRNLGMEDGTFMQMQMQGAGIARAGLMSGRAGARTATRFAQDLLLNNTDEQLMDITGASTGAEGAAQVAGSLTSSVAQYLRGTPGGRAFLVNMGKQRGGAFTGEIDTAALAKFASGGVRLDQLAGQGKDKMLSRLSQSSFKTHEQDIASSLLDSEQGVYAVLQSFEQQAKSPQFSGMDHDDTVALLMEQQLRTDAKMTHQLIEWGKNYAKNRDEKLRRIREEQAASLLQREMRQNYTIAGLTQQVTGGISDFFAPVKQVGADFTVAMQETGQSIYDSAMGVDRAQMGVSARRASIARIASGRGMTSGITQSSYDDFEFGTAGQSMAAQEMFFGASGGVRRSVALQQRLAAGGDLTMGDIGLGDKSQGSLDEFLNSSKGNEVQSAILKSKQARAMGDTKEAEAQLARARRMIETGMYSGQPGGSALNGSGLTERYLAAAALRAGDASLAKEVMGKGDVRSHTYGDVSQAHKEAVSSLTDIGVKSELAEQLAGGGVGSELFIKTAGTSLGLDYFSNLAQRKAVRDQLSNVSADDPRYFEILAQQAGKELGGSFTGEDVRAVMQASLQAKQEAGSYNWFGLKGPDQRTRMENARHGFAAAGQKAQHHVDLRTNLSAVQSATTALGSASEEMKAALGPAYNNALTGLQSLSAGVGPDGKPLSDSARAAVFTNLDALLDKADSSGVAGMLGGQELGDLAAKRKRALEAARSGDVAAIAQAYGIQGDDVVGQIESLTGVGKGKKTLSNAELEAAVKGLSSQDALASLSAGEGGGIFLRGMTKDQQVAYDMRRTSEQVAKTAETVTAMTLAAEKAGLILPPSGH